MSQGIPQTKEDEVFDLVTAYYAANERNDFELHRLLREARQAVKEFPYSSNALSALLIVHAMRGDAQATFEQYELGKHRLQDSCDSLANFLRNSVKCLTDVGNHAESARALAQLAKLDIHTPSNIQGTLDVLLTSLLIEEAAQWQKRKNRESATPQADDVNVLSFLNFLKKNNIATEIFPRISELMLKIIAKYSNRPSELAVGISEQLYDDEGHEYFEVLFRPPVSNELAFQILEDFLDSKMHIEGLEKTVGLVNFDIREGVSD